MARTSPLVIGTVLLSTLCGVAPTALPADPPIRSDQPYEVTFDPVEARFVRVVIQAGSSGNQPCIDELEVYGPDRSANLALDRVGATATASSCLSGYSKHAVAHLNDGRYGNDRSWIPATSGVEWAQIELARTSLVSKVILSRDRARQFGDRIPTEFEVRLSQDGQTWQTVRRVSAVAISGAASQGQDAAPRLPGPPPPPKRDGGAWRTGGLSASSLAAPRQDGRGLPNLALAPDAKASASSVYAGGAMPIHQIRHLNDGWAGNDHSWIANTGGPEWAEIDLGADYWICRVALGNDNSGRFGDRGATTYTILTAREHTEDSSAPQWTRVAQRNGAPLLLRTEITFAPVQARYVRVLLEGSSGEPRLDEVEVYGRPTPLATADVGPLTPEERPEPTGVTDALLKYAFVGEEHAWLKTYGRADLDPSLVPYNGRVQQYPRHVGDDALPLPRLADGPVVDGELDDAAWALSSRGVARVADPRDFDQGPLVECAVRAGIAGSDLALAIHVDRLLSSHVAVVSAADWQGCGIVTWTEGGLVFRTFTPQGEPAESRPIEGACSDDLTGFELRIPLEWLPGAAGRGVRVGLGLGALHTPAVGRPVYFRPSDLAVAEEGPCLHGCFRLRLTNTGERPVDVTGTAPALRGGLTLGPGEVRVLDLASASGPIGPELDVTLVEPGREAYELHLFRYDPLERTLDLMEGIADRLEAAGLEVARERRQVSELRARQEELLAAAPDRSAERQVLWEARVAKRDLLLRDPDLAVLDRVLFAKRFAYWPSHIYTDYTDAPFRPGGGVYTLSIPRIDGRLAPGQGQLTRLFDGSNGIVRDPAPTFDAQRIYFGYRPSADGFYHIMTMAADGSGLKQLTDGPFHDFYPCPLPNGDVAFITTRCASRVFCFRWTSSTLHAMSPDGTHIRPLSYSSLSEWAPSVMSDGRIIWTRWEYVDKGADFSQTLWSIQPDGTEPELVFGNTIIQPNGYASGRQVPGTMEISCTLVSHFGDINGPIALLDLSKGRFNPEAITSITPEVPWPGMWPARECFRDPLPLSRDLFLCSHAPADRFGLYVIDRYGNRELLYLDPAIDSMGPLLFHPTTPPPVLSETVTATSEDSGTLLLMDVNRGLEPTVERGRVRYLRVVEEVRHDLHMNPNLDHADFMKWYASPVDIVAGPFGWPAYVAKAPLGLVPVAEDGSACFTVPSGHNVYFQALDEDFNELQRMRSLVQMQPGEKRTCVGCHEGRNTAPPGQLPIAARSGPIAIEPPSFGARPFSFEATVQPVLDARCVRCHDASHPMGADLTGTLDDQRVPASYRTLITKGYVNYVDCGWNSGGCEKLEPLTFGTVRSRLWEVLNAGHHDVQLTRDEMLRIKTWIDLNCPLWPDYIERSQRTGALQQVAGP